MLSLPGPVHHGQEPRWLQEGKPKQKGHIAYITIQIFCNTIIKNIEK